MFANPVRTNRVSRLAENKVYKTKLGQYLLCNRRNYNNYFFITRHLKIINFIPHRITRNLITILSIAFFLHSKHQSVYRADGEGEGKSIFRLTDIFQKECLENEFCCRSSGGYPGGQNIGFVPRPRMIRYDFLSKDNFQYICCLLAERKTIITFFEGGGGGAGLAKW